MEVIETVALHHAGVAEMLHSSSSDLDSYRDSDEFFDRVQRGCWNPAG